MGLYSNPGQNSNVLLYQTHSDGKTTAYMWRDGKNLRVEGDEARQLRSKVEAEGGEIREFNDDHLIIARGFDLQTHLRHPGQQHKETLEGGLISAFEGGYDAVVAMPNTTPFLDNPEIIKTCLEGVRELGFDEVTVAQTAAATVGMKGQEPADISALKKAGAIAITDDGWGVESDAAMREVFKRCASENLLFMQHAERPGHGGYAPKSEFQTRFDIPEYPGDAESWMVKRDVQILKDVPGARYHVLHVTTAMSVEAIREAKKKGLAITAEVSPHHLFFSNEEIPHYNDENSTNYKMNPPLFTSKDRDALREGLRDGTLDCISTDHAPHPEDEKKNTWDKAPFGTRGLETALSALCTLCHEGHFDWDKVEHWFSTRPRQILPGVGCDEPKGFVVVDKNKNWTVTPADLPGISGNSIFLGHTLKGKITGILTPKGFYAQA